MGTIDLSKSPPHAAASHAAASYPHKPAGSPRNTPSYEDLQQAISRMAEAEADNVFHHLKDKLPPYIFERLDSQGSLKEKLSHSIDRHYRTMFNRPAASDNRTESAVCTHTSGEIAQLLRSMGGAGVFNHGEIEKSREDRGNIDDLEAHTNDILRQKADAGAFPHEDAGSIVKCVFRDNALKPKTVADVRLAVNIPDSALISPVFHSHAAAKYLIKEVIFPHIIESIDKEIDGCAEGELEERITGLLTGVTIADFDLSDARDIEHIRTNGFSMAAHMLVSILDNENLGYQFIEHRKDEHELVIREYEDVEPANLPDERYAIRLRYIDQERLAKDRAAYEAQVNHFDREVQHLWNLIEVIYQDSKSVFKVNDFEDLAKKNKSRIRDLVKRKAGEGLYEVTGETGGQDNIRAKLARMHERIKNMYEFLYPIERRVMEDRLAWLETECARFDFAVNPRHLQSGLLIDADITSIKRKKTTLDSLAAVLEELVRGAHRSFQDAALAAFDVDASPAHGRKV